MKVIIIGISTLLGYEADDKNKDSLEAKSDLKQPEDPNLQADNEEDNLSVIEENNKEEDDESRNDNISQGYASQNAEYEHEKLSVVQNNERTSFEGILRHRNVGNILKRSEFTNQETLDELTNQRNINSMKRKIEVNSSIGDYESIVKLASPNKLKSKAWSVAKNPNFNINDQNRNRGFTFGSNNGNESKENIVQNIMVLGNNDKNDDTLFDIIKSNDLEKNNEIPSKISKGSDFSHKRTFEDIFTKDEIIEQNNRQSSKVLIQGDNYFKAPRRSLRLKEVDKKKVEESDNPKVETKTQKSAIVRVKSKPKISKLSFLQITNICSDKSVKNITSKHICQE